LNIELLVQYLSIGIAIVATIIGHSGMKRYIPVAMFASLYANMWCYIANYFHWWEFPIRVLPGIKDISFAANVIVVPVLAMFWVRYSPMSRIKWALLWSLILTFFEYGAQRYSAMVEYHNGYTAYHSFILWLISWYIWYSFHKWFYKDGGPH
jgi:hypothetical protein